jgi:hypothetical protein
MRAFNITASIALLLFFVFSCTSDKHELPQPDDGCIVPALITWDNSMNALIQAKCSIEGCHVPADSGGNGFDFRTYAGVKEKIDNGVFQNRVFVLQDMPPAGSTVLSACELRQLQTWIDKGAPQ